MIRRATGHDHGPTTARAQPACSCLPCYDSDRQLDAPECQAGIALASRIREEKPDVPLLLQSAQPSESDLARQASSLGARFVSKNDPSLLSRLREFMLEDMSFGPLTFRRGAGANEALGSVATVTQLMNTWERLPLSSVAYHARNCDLSRWFNARAEFQLARRFKASNFPEDFIDSTVR